MASPIPSPSGVTTLPVRLGLLVAAFAGGIAMSDSVRSSTALLTSSFRLASNSVISMDPANLPAQAQLMLPEATVVLPHVPPPSVANGTTVFVPPGMTLDDLLEKPFHIHHPDFLEIIGQNPTLTKIADSGENPMFHEAPVWYSETDEMFFCQNAGAKAAGTGLEVSAVISKIHVAQAAAVGHQRDATGQVQVDVVDFEPAVINPNGGTNYKGDIIFAGEGMGADIAPALYLANPVHPYNTTLLVNNYYGRQFNSLNDVAVNPVNGDIYFTDVTYGYLQDFRPAPALKNQVYRLDAKTKALSVVADEQLNCNGIAFSPDGKYAYITETGGAQGFYGFDDAAAAGIYRYTVASDGTFESRKIFAHVTARLADGVHCDTNGNVYAGCGDGVHVWNPSGVRLGTIFTGRTAANFQFAGQGRMVIMGETHLYFATLGATGAALT